MKIVKKNAIILGVLFFVCVAVYLNWSFGQNSNEQSKDEASSAGISDNNAAQVIAVSQSDPDSEAGLYFEPETTQTVETDLVIETDYSEYFAAVRLSRSQARDEATQTLQVACSTTEASQEFIETATLQIMDIAQWTMKEADIENLIMAKGFDDCVVYMTQDSISVTVPAPTEGLSDASVARITDVIMSETDYQTQQIKIVEIK